MTTTADLLSAGLMMMSVLVLRDLRAWRSSRAAKATLGFIKRNLYSCSRQIKNLAYKSLIRPGMEYCGSVWDPRTQELIQKLEAVQNRAARFVMADYERYSSVTSMKEELEWELLEDRRKTTRISVFQQALMGHLAIPMHNILRPVQRASRHSRFTQLPASKNCLKFSFMNRTIKDWNNTIPNHRYIEDKDKFKSVKQYIKDNENTFNTALTETASELLGKHRHVKKPWITKEVLELCDRRRELKCKRNNPDGARDYREANKLVKKGIKEAKENWIGQQCEEVESSLNKSNSRKAYQLVKNLTTVKNSRSATIQDKNGKCLVEDKEILSRWTEYCSDLYNYELQGDPSILDCPQYYPDNEESQPILREEVETAVRALKKGKSPGIDNVPGELVQAAGDAAIDVLTKICNNIWKTGKWPTPWTQSLVITLPKKGNLQLCQNYRTISLISHPSKIMLRLILNRLKPLAENIIAEEQAGFRAGRSTTEQIFNLRILCEKHLQHQQDLYHVFIDFKKAFDRVWHAALWATMRTYNINPTLVRTIEQLYSNAMSAVLANGNIGDWFQTSVGVRQGCLLSPTLFNLFLERIMADALENHEGTVNIGGRAVSNLRFADDIDGLAGSEEELKSLINNLHQTSLRYGMEISAEKTKLMTNNPSGINEAVEISDQRLGTVTSFKYLGAIISDEGSKPEVLSRIAQTTSAMAKLKPLWNDKNISLGSKIKLMRTLAISIFLYACETWTLTADLERRIQALELRCFRKILNISYKDHVTNEEVRTRVKHAIGPYDDLLTTVRQRKLRWYGHISRSSGLAKTILQGTVVGTRRRGRQKKRWEDNIREWTGLNFATSQRAVEDRNRWREIVKMSSVVPRRPSRLREQ
ncbi:uncharacterized protein [Amphiura filiformis]|uniref:uncharacterized protein n=1 Tax=Amphiura filiformis TaxID=82378 RepID=UPI003B216227